jgi:hypothetical protein
LKDVRLVKPPRLWFLLDWNQRAADAHQLIRPADQPISPRAQSRCALSRVIHRLDRSTAETNLRTLTPTPAAQQRIDSNHDDH